LTFKGYKINGKTFYMIAQDKRSTNQNGVVHIDATDSNENKETYYCHIKNIWELNCGPSFKAPQQLSSIILRDQPFVLAKDGAKMFYVKDMSTKPKKRKKRQVKQ